MNKIINKSETYYIYNIVNSTFIVKLDSKQELINWLAYRQSLENDYNNRYLKYFVCDFRESGYLKREYMVLDGYDRIIDIRCFYKEILEVAIKESNKPYRYNRGTWYISAMRREVGHNYEGTKLRQNAATEIQEYVRPSRTRFNLPNSWDEISRHIEKSWKSQRKCSKQWMKNLK